MGRPMASISCRRCCRTSSISSSRKSCRCCRSGACSARSIRERPCAPISLCRARRCGLDELADPVHRRRRSSAEWHARNRLAIHAKTIRAADLDPELCARIRASILLAGPLLARCGELTLPPPGGDVIGRRRLDTHVLAFEQLGATVTASDRLYFRSARLKGADVFLDEPSVTATENALVAAVGAHGTTFL